MDGEGRFVEVQGTAEGATFSRAEMNALLDLAEAGIRDILLAQRDARLP
jgi:ribonuclease PH